MAVIIPKHSVVPTKKSDTFTTTHDNQGAIHVPPRSVEFAALGHRTLRCLSLYRPHSQ